MKNTLILNFQYEHDDRCLRMTFRFCSCILFRPSNGLGTVIVYERYWTTATAETLRWVTAITFCCRAWNFAYSARSRHGLARCGVFDRTVRFSSCPSDRENLGKSDKIFASLSVVFLYPTLLWNESLVSCEIYDLDERNGLAVTTVKN